MTKKTTTLTETTLFVVRATRTVTVIETTGEPVPPTPRSVHPGPGLAKCLPTARELRLAGGAR